VYGIASCRRLCTWTSNMETETNENGNFEFILRKDNTFASSLEWKVRVMGPETST